MRRVADLHDAILLGAITYFFTYATPLFVELPGIYYLPLAREWVAGTKPDGLTMDWFGRTIIAVVLGVLAGGLAWPILAHRPERPASRGLSYAAATLLVVVMAVYAYHYGARELGPRVPPAKEAEAEPRRP